MKPAKSSLQISQSVCYVTLNRLLSCTQLNAETEQRVPLFTLVLSSEVFANWVGKCTNGKRKEEWANTGPNIQL